MQAEVTGGGIPLSEVDCSTMESRVLPGVYLCGEILDVFGRIGGFNFYWAWLTGRLAGQHACRKPPCSEAQPMNAGLGMEVSDQTGGLPG